MLNQSLLHALFNNVPRGTFTFVIDYFINFFFQALRQLSCHTLEGG